MYVDILTLITHKTKVTACLLYVENEAVFF